jgi:bifunctional DNA-binding transcriptional regulator/antitoxin component of YhaV-PrlF toxin-antitoxin module
MSVITLPGTGQILPPQALRQALGLQAGDQLEIALDGDRLVLTRVHSPKRPSKRFVQSCLTLSATLEPAASPEWK